MNETFSPVKKNSSAKSDSIGDSFFINMSPHRNQFTLEETAAGELSHLGITEGVKKWIDSKTNSAECSRVSETKKEPVSGLTSASTPVLSKNICVANFIAPDMHDSPIQPNESPGEEYKKLIRDVVTEVTRDHINDHMDGLGRYFLNLQMCLSKQFVNQKEFFASLLKSRNDLQAQNEQLKEENEFLKRKINELWKNQ